jgi:UDP-N-acetylmuramate--alanine ligase
MSLFGNIENIYFSGIGGIGMSALARYFIAGGYNVAGYDRARSNLTDALVEEGCLISYNDLVSEIPAEFKNLENTIIVYTPAIPQSNNILSFFRSNEYVVLKRSAVLGMISAKYRTIAVAGTHGKTSVSTITAHILKQSTLDCTAFLGGISKNYNTNMILGEGAFTVMEADEYDKSFHTLSPEIALITSMDPDHLEVYGSHEGMIEAYRKFANGIITGGTLIVHSSIRSLLYPIDGVKILTYGDGPDCDFKLLDSNISDDYYHFSIEYYGGKIENLRWSVVGKRNLNNALAAIAISLTAGVTSEEIRKSLLYFKGVERRFDIKINSPGFIFIDDYAHHPEELNFLISSVREFYGDRRITAVFQPHLFTRTKEHAISFARSLEKLDKVLLLPIYPAREEPIEGVSSKLILDEMVSGNPELVTEEQLYKRFLSIDTEIFITIGAGNIDKMVENLWEKAKAIKG